MSELSELINFFVFVLGKVIECLDSFYIGGVSYLDIMIALILLDVLIWFIRKVLVGGDKIS